MVCSFAFMSCDRSFLLVDSSTNRQISSIIVRDQFLIVKLEYLRAIITPQGVVLLDAKNPVIREFAQYLQVWCFFIHVFATKRKRLL